MLPKKRRPTHPGEMLRERARIFAKTAGDADADDNAESFAFMEWLLREALAGVRRN